MAQRRPTPTQPSLTAQIAQLEHMTVQELRDLYQQARGIPTASRNRRWLVKRTAFALQERAEGGLSERAQRQAKALAQGLNLRQVCPRETVSEPDSDRHKQCTLPTWNRDSLGPGMILRREYRGRTIIAEVREDGFEHEGVLYQSLSGLANAVTGSKWNGYAFFGLNKRGKRHD